MYPKKLKVVTASSVVVSGSTLTITIPYTNLYDYQEFILKVSQVIPIPTTLTDVKLTDGSKTYTCLNKIGNTLTSDELKRNCCQKDIYYRVVYGANPEHITFLCIPVLGL